MAQIKIKPKPKAAPIKNKKDSYDLIIIGGGPAGLTAAIYAKRSKLSVLLVEKMILGGMASTTYYIENYPGFPEGISGMELSQRLQNQIKRMEVEVSWGNAISIENNKNNKEVTIDSKTYKAKAVIIATGTESAKLGVPGEGEFRGRGVSYCATCDGAFYKDKNIMVIGGGNSAIEEALFLTRYGKKVSIVHRRDKLRAEKILADRAKANPKIYFFWNSTVNEIRGKQKIEEVVLNDLQAKKKIKVQVDGIFVYVGSKPNSDIVKGIIKLDKNGYIITNDEMKTSVDGIFAAGDIRVKTLRQIVTAAADGAIAAEAARKYIEGSNI
jgi:thioredoxin reductase (NADPH)